ncbi:MAG: YibE/F family protein [Acidimicrobiaceae bacterium]|nr:YibE/F family protein [Acidimicrobiaceae bacterium]
MLIAAIIVPMGDGSHHRPGPDLGSGPREWLSDRVLLSVLVFVGLAGVAAVVGLVLLWPTGEGRDAAQERADEIGLAYQRLTATVTEVADRVCSYSGPDDPQACRTITVRVDEGSNAGTEAALPEFNLTYDRTSIRISPGDKVIVGYEDSNDYYFFGDRDRRTPLVWLAGRFAAVGVALGRLRGAMALVGMAATLVVLVAFVAPSVLDGNHPVLVAVVAAAVIAFVGLYVTHGLNARTTVALAGTLASLGLTLGLSWVFFGLAEFTGLATEEGLTLPLIAGDVDLASLLLGGAIIGALGALDDVTVTQVATVAELRHHSPHLPRREIIASGIRVGREHIAATVNTLLLAYAGAGLPLVLLFAVSDQSLAMVANSELIAVEIVRTLCGSLGLVAAVPVTTVLAALVKAGASTPEVGTPESAEPDPEPRWADFAPDPDEPEW